MIDKVFKEFKVVFNLSVPLLYRLVWELNCGENYCVFITLKFLNNEVIN